MMKLKPIDLFSADPNDIHEGLMADAAPTPQSVAFKPGLFGAAKAQEEWSPSKWEILDGVLGGTKTWTESRKALETEHLALQREAQMRKLIDQTITDPRERLTALANLKDWAAQNATRYGAANVEGGATRVYGEPGKRGSSTYTAPKIEKFDDRFGVFDPEAGETGYTAPRDPTFQEKTSRQDTLLDHLISQLQLGETSRHNRASEGLGWAQEGRLGRAAAAAAGPALPGGGANPQGTLAAIAAELAKRNGGR